LEQGEEEADGELHVSYASVYGEEMEVVYGSLWVFSVCGGECLGAGSRWREIRVPAGLGGIEDYFRERFG
jgi:hypothetical protein